MKKKRSSKKQAVPKKGDPDYLTPTQLRNRRKRRAKQQAGDVNNSKSSNSNNGGGDARAVDAGGATNNNSGKKSSTAPNSNNNNNNKDPSMKYITNPMKAPIVQTAKQYFQPILQQQDGSNNTTNNINNNNNNNEFHVHLGPLYQWRTVSKLAVRPSGDGDEVAIGLFLPQSHTLLPVPNCRAHHPSINRAVECITRACHEVGVVPYQENGKKSSSSSSAKVDNDDVDDAVDSKNSMIEEKGTGQLRYVAVNVARETGAVQITLVWNTPPPGDDIGTYGKKAGRGGSKRKHDDDDETKVFDDPVLEKLVTKLISMSKDNTNNNPSTKDEKEGGMLLDTPNETSCKSTDEQSTKKRRRRGRRDGKSVAKEGGSSDFGGDNKTKNCSTGNNINAKSSSVNKESSHREDNPPKKLNLHSLWINYNPSWKHSNAIFSFDSSNWRHVHGPPAIIEQLIFGMGQKKQPKKSNENDVGRQLLSSSLANPKPPNFPISLTFPPNVFRQANLDAFTNIVGRIRERMQTLAIKDDESDQNNVDTTVVVELYGGVGTIGLHISDIVSSLVSSDENPNNSKCFYDSVRELPPHIQSRLVYRQKNAADMVTSETALFERSQVLIVDPPRKGLDIEVVDYLCQRGYETMKLVIYVSCGFQAFQRDCDALLKSGRWKVEFAEGYLLFPGSDAIETLAFFVPVE